MNVIFMMGTKVKYVVEYKFYCYIVYHSSDYCRFFFVGDEDIVYLYSKWLEHKGKLSESMKVRDQFDRNKVNTITCDNVVMTFVLENKHGLEDTIIGEDVMDDLFASTDDKPMDLDNEMDPADDDIFSNLFLD